MLGSDYLQHLYISMDSLASGFLIYIIRDSIDYQGTHDYEKDYKLPHSLFFGLKILIISILAVCIIRIGEISCRSRRKAPELNHEVAEGPPTSGEHYSALQSIVSGIYIPWGLY